MTETALRLGIAGLGTVGVGVLKVIDRHGSALAMGSNVDAGESLGGICSFTTWRDASAAGRSVGDGEITSLHFEVELL